MAIEQAGLLHQKGYDHKQNGYRNYKDRGDLSLKIKPEAIPAHWGSSSFLKARRQPGLGIHEHDLCDTLSVAPTLETNEPKPKTAGRVQSWKNPNFVPEKPQLCATDCLQQLQFPPLPSGAKGQQSGALSFLILTPSKNRQREADFLAADRRNGATASARYGYTRWLRSRSRSRPSQPGQVTCSNPPATVSVCSDLF